MIREILDININETLEESFEMIIDNYVLPTNTPLYILITDTAINLYQNPNPEIKLFKNSSIEMPSIETHKKLKEFDFYSRIENTNKALSKKKDILSNNIYSLIIQKQSLFNQEIFQDHYEDYTRNILNCINATVQDKDGKLDKDTNKLLKKFNHLHNNILSNVVFEETKNLFISNISNCLNILNEHDISKMKDKDHKIAIFVDTDLENYKKEYFRYLYAKIFNKNEYNIQIENKILGIPDFNNSLDKNKKPFCKKVTRLNTNMYPLFFTVDDAIKLQTNFQLCSKNSNKYKKIFIKKSPNEIDEINEEISSFGYYMLTYKEPKKGKVIEDFDVIPHVSESKINLTIKNFVGVNFFEPQRIYKKSELHHKIDEIWFNKKLIESYNTEKLTNKKNKDNLLDGIIITYRTLFKNYFILNNEKPLIPQIDTISKKILMQKLHKSKLYKDKNEQVPESLKELINIFNLRLSLLEFFQIGGYENMEVRTKSVFQNVYDYTINKQNISLNDDEFYFLIGQTIKYLFSQSEAQKIQYNKYFDCIDKKDSKQIKEQLNLLFKKYAHKISTKNFKFNNVYSFILSYEPQNKKVDLDMLLLGFIYNENIYFIKSEKEEESTDNVG